MVTRSEASGIKWKVATMSVRARKPGPAFSSTAYDVILYQSCSQAATAPV